MKVLITGINGAVGGNLFRLFQHNEQFSSTGLSRNPYHVGNLIRGNIDIPVHTSDMIASPPRPEFYNQFDCILHAAAITPKTAKSSADFQQNELIAENLANSLSSFLGKVIFMSTGSVYMGKQQHVTEKSPTNIEDPYAIAMLAAEHILQEKVQNLVIFRLFYPYGFDQYSKDDNLVSKLINQAKDNLAISVNSTAVTSLINPLYFSDLYQIALYFILNDPRPGIVNIAGPEPCSFLEFVEHIFTVLHLPQKKLVINDLLSSPLCGNIELLASFYDINKMTSFRDGIKKIVN